MSLRASYSLQASCLKSLTYIMIRIFAFGLYVHVSANGGLYAMFVPNIMSFAYFVCLLIANAALGLKM